MAQEYDNLDMMADAARKVVEGWDAQDSANGQPAEHLARIEQRVTEGMENVLRRLETIEGHVHRLSLTTSAEDGALPDPRYVAEHPPVRNKDELDIEAAWGFRAKSEPRWPASIAVVAAIILYILLPEKLIWINTRWIVPVLETALLLPLAVIAPHRHVDETAWRRWTSIGLIVIINTANLASLVLLVDNLVGGHARASGTDLIYAAADIWLTNVIVFALWYWELDRGGPGKRCGRTHRQPDFLFPQMTTAEAALPHWSPQFIDYLYVSFSNAEAFSPTDTMPLTYWAKLLMLVQSLASLITIALVAARAVNILS